MRDRLALRTPFGGVLTILAIAGWRPLHRDVLLRMQEDASVRDRVRDRVRRLQDAMQSNVVGMFLCAPMADHPDVTYVRRTASGGAHRVVVVPSNDVAIAVDQIARTILAFTRLDFLRHHSSFNRYHDRFRNTRA